MLHGVLPVFQTPYRDDESIDFDTLDAELDWIFACGADGVVMAMVSEILRLATGEREQLATHVCRKAGDRGTIVIGTGAESSRTAQRLARHAEAASATAVMAIPPISVALPDDELFGYYAGIVNSVSIPVIVQDASGYVGRPMSIDLQARLLDEFGERIFFKPEADPIGPRLTALHEATGGAARVFEGSGGIALVDSYRRGIVGTMPGGDLVDAVVALWNALEAGDGRRAEEISRPLSSLIGLQTSLDAFLAVEKYLLVKRGIFRNRRVRGPVGYRLDEKTRSEVDRLYATLMAVLGDARAEIPGI
ncbi:MAG: dihydrodipicolinate synthase family protein [Planctomycetaceae bacterium]